MGTYFTFENLHSAYIDCKKRKNPTFYHQKFAYDLEKNLFLLETELRNRTYQPQRSIAFVVSKSKTREIFAADFRDRVIHHLLYNYLTPIFEPRFIYDSWACRPKKGTHQAMLRIQHFQRLITKNTSANKVLYLKMDIKSFFTSIDKEILYSLIERKVKREEILWLCKVNIFHDCARDIPPRIQSQASLFDSLPPDKSLFTVPRGKGLPIGNLTSQFFANVYLNELDAFVKHTLKIKYYVRYVDDFVMMHESIDELKRYEREITAFLLDRLKLIIHPKKVFIRPISDGIDFVGYVVRPDYILIRKRVVGDWRHRMEIAPDKIVKERMFHSYKAHALWANSHKLQQVMQKRLA